MPPTAEVITVRLSTLVSIGLAAAPTSPEASSVTEAFVPTISSPSTAVSAMPPSDSTSVTFPLPAPLQAATAKITLDPANFLFHTMPTGVRRYFSHRIERVDVRFNNATIVTTYSDYRDWNASDYKSDALLPGRMVHERNGVKVLDLTLTQSQTYNPYVVMPVPDNVRKVAAR